MNKEEFIKRQIDIKLHENALYKETNELLSDMLNSMTYQEKQKINGINCNLRIDF